MTKVKGIIPLRFPKAEPLVRCGATLHEKSTHNKQPIGCALRRKALSFSAKPKSEVYLISEVASKGAVKYFAYGKKLLLGFIT